MSRKEPWWQWFTQHNLVSYVETTSTLTGYPISILCHIEEFCVKICFRHQRVLVLYCGCLLYSFIEQLCIFSICQASNKQSKVLFHHRQLQSKTTIFIITMSDSYCL